MQLLCIASIFVALKLQTGTESDITNKKYKIYEFIHIPPRYSETPKLVQN